MGLTLPLVLLGSLVACLVAAAQPCCQPSQAAAAQPCLPMQTTPLSEGGMLEEAPRLSTKCSASGRNPYIQPKGGRRMARHLPPSYRTPQLLRWNCRSTKIEDGCLSGSTQCAPGPAALKADPNHCEGNASPCYTPRGTSTAQHQHRRIHCAAQNCACQVRQWATQWMASAKKAISRQCETWSAQLDAAAALAVTFNGRVLLGMDGQWPSIKLEGWVQSDPPTGNTNMCVVELSTKAPYLQDRSAPGCWLELVGSVAWMLVRCAITHVALRTLVRLPAQQDAAA